MFATTCGNVVQYLSDDLNPVDPNIFLIDSNDYDPVEEVKNPRQFTITSDGSPDHQGEYNLVLHYYYAEDPWPEGD